MRLLQLYYTSCKQGLSSGAGFQVYAASDGLTTDEMMELEQRSIYVPPTHLPTQPTDEEIQENFPIAFSTFRLKSGRYGINQSVYVGKDYSGRYGNYFTHALVLEEGEWPFAPILLYGSADIRTGLTEEELAIEHKPEPLPPLSISKSNGKLSLPLVQNFLKEENRYTQFQAMLNGLIERNGQPGSMIIADDQKHVPYWIAAIQLAFPLQIANKLSFSTYSFDPANDNHVISVTLNEGTRFSFQDIGRRYKLYGFNFITEQFSKPNESYQYADHVVTNQLDIAPLDKFAKSFTLQQATEKLDAFVDFYMLLTGIPFVETSKVELAFQFAKNNLVTEKASAFIDELPITQLIEKPHTIAIATFLIDVSNETKTDSNQAIAARFIFEKIAELATEDYSSRDIGGVVDAEDEVNAEDVAFNDLTRMNHLAVASTVFLEEERLQYLLENLKEMNDPPSRALYIELALNMIYEAQIEWDDLREDQEFFIQTLSEQAFLQEQLSKDEVNAFKQHPNYFTHISLALYNQDKTTLSKEHLLRNIMQVTKGHQTESNWMDTYFAILDDGKNGSKLLNDYFITRLKKSHHVDDMSDMLIDAANIQSFDLSNIVSAYADQLLQSDQDFLRNADKLMNEPNLYTILDQHDVLTDILHDGQSYIVFSDPSVEQHVQTYEKFHRYYHEKKANTSVYELAVITYKTKQQRRKNSNKLEEVLLENLTEQQAVFSEDLLQAYVLWSLPEVMHIVYDDKKQDSKLIQALIHTHADIVLDALISRRQKVKLKYPHHLLVDLLISWNTQDKNKKVYDQLVQYLLENDYQDNRMQELLQVQPDLLKEWDKLHEDVKEQKGSTLVRSIKNIFKSQK